MKYNLQQNEETLFGFGPLMPMQLLHSNIKLLRLVQYSVHHVI